MTALVPPPSPAPRGWIREPALTIYSGTIRSSPPPSTAWTTPSPGNSGKGGPEVTVRKRLRRRRRGRSLAGTEARAVLGGGWILNKVVDCLGVQLSISTTTIGPDGSTNISQYNRSQGDQGRTEGSSLSHSTYTSKNVRTYVQGDGQRVTVRKMERDGNQIEEKILDGRVVERTVNGKSTRVAVGAEEASRNQIRA